MSSIPHKLQVLAKIAARCNQENILWAVGASLLLFLQGYVDDFHDLDILVAEDDALQMEEILKSLGTLQSTSFGDGIYKTKRFSKFVIEGVDLDMMGGFAIVHDGILHDCDVKPSQISGYTQVYGQTIPLHSIPLWRTYYSWMGREQKVAIIDEKTDL